MNFKYERSPQVSRSKEFTSGYAGGLWGFWCLRAWMRQTWNDDAGVFCTPLHGLIGSVWHGVQVRRVLVQLPASVSSDGLFAVDVHLSVRVNGDHHLSDVGVDTALFKPIQTTGDILLIYQCRHALQLSFHLTSTLIHPHLLSSVVIKVNLLAIADKVNYLKAFPGPCVWQINMVDNVTCQEIQSSQGPRFPGSYVFRTRVKGASLSLLSKLGSWMGT